MTPAEATILVVDDDVFMREYYRNVLKAFGVENILEAGTCEYARELLKDTEVHGAFVDVVMQCCSGFEIAADLKAKNIPMVFSTSVDDGHNRAMMAEYGFSIAKPLAVQSIRLALHFFLGCQMQCTKQGCEMRTRGACQ